MSPRIRGFSLVEVLVAVAIFAVLSAMTWSGLSTIMRSRAALEEAGERLHRLQLVVAMVERDARQAVARPVRGANGEVLPALMGTTTALELTHGAFARPDAEARAAIARSTWSLDAKGVRRGTFAVLDRASSTAPASRVLLDDVDELRFRYLAADGNWRDSWPPRDGPARDDALLPRALEVRISAADLGDVVRLLELPDGEPPPAEIGP